ncbi:ROK family protein [Paenibacillus yanchengensis]|uniref:ROK family protein n=1 Tax=Paenibacillus yanchengensis TaxID=2035833 RepID=A0ABW4YFE1_9BACL
MKAKSTGDQALIKKINTAIVLDAVLQHEPISRAKISVLTGLNKATVSNLVQDLLDQQLVLEAGTGKSSGGRKPVILHFNHRAGFAIGIDLGVNYLHGILTDVTGNILHKYELAHQLRDSEQIIELLVECVQQLSKQMPESPYGLVGLGIGVPGLVDELGTVLLAPHLLWKQVNLQQILETRLQVPVIVDNEANAGALGELIYGAGRKTTNQIYISVGIGIGTGLVLNNQLYKGAYGYSGELGHMSIKFDGDRCSCGNYGCWELYASEQALLNGAASLGMHSLSQLLQAAESGHKEVLALFDHVGAFLGTGIANIVNTFNPDLIIIGNRMSRARKFLASSVQEAIIARTLPLNREHIKLQFAELEDHSAVHGAAYAALARFLTQVKEGNLI